MKYFDKYLKKVYNESEEMYLIKNEKDLRNIQNKYGDDIHFEIVETGEILTLPDIRYNYDNQIISIRVVE